MFCLQFVLQVFVHMKRGFDLIYIHCDHSDKTMETGSNNAIAKQHWGGEYYKMLILYVGGKRDK